MLHADWRAQVDLADANITAAPYGGAIGWRFFKFSVISLIYAVGVWEDTSKIHLYTGRPKDRATVRIYNSSGQFISRILWEKVNIKCVAFSENELVILVTATGQVRCYTLFSEYTNFSLPLKGNATVVAGKVCKSALVVQLSDNTFVYTSLLTPHPIALSKFETLLQGHDVEAWEVSLPRDSPPSELEVLISTRQTILAIDEMDARDKLLDQGPFIQIAVSDSATLLALYSKSGTLLVTSSDFERNLAQVELQDRYITDQPIQMVWCGEDSVLIGTAQNILMVGPSGGVLEFQTGLSMMCPDFDGVRVISASRFDFIQKVPESNVETFKIGSSSPSAVLLDAVEHMERKSARADENIKLIQSQMSEAVSTCIKAAAQEWSIRWQTQLLKVVGTESFLLLLTTLGCLFRQSFY